MKVKINQILPITLVLAFLSLLNSANAQSNNKRLLLVKDSITRIYRSDVNFNFNKPLDVLENLEIIYLSKIYDVKIIHFYS
jgi:hypothetical protein